VFFIEDKRVDSGELTEEIDQIITKGKRGENEGILEEQKKRKGRLYQ